MTSQDLAMFNAFGALYNGIAVFAALLMLSQVALALSVNSSAKARNIANRPLFVAGTLLGAVPAAIMYACSRKKLTRTDEVKGSAATFWLVVAIILAVAAIISYVVTFVTYAMSVTSAMMY